MDRVTQARLALVRDLSEKDLHIYNMEVERRKRSVALTYVLWFFFGVLGVHRFYLNQWLGAVNLLSFLYVALTLPVVFGSDMSGLTFLWFLCVLYLAFSLFIDLFTIPWQVSSANERIAQSILKSMVEQDRGGKPQPIDYQPPQ